MATVRLNFQNFTDSGWSQSTWPGCELSYLMGRLRKGKRQKSQDLWQLAGGRDALLKTLMKHNLSDSATAEKWMAVTVDVFKKKSPK